MSRSCPQEQQIIRASRSILVNNETDDAHKLVPDILGVVAEYVGVPEPQELRILRQLIHLLPPFINEVPFVKKKNNIQQK